MGKAVKEQEEGRHLQVKAVREFHIVCWRYTRHRKRPADEACFVDDEPAS